jgi:hypothetical protein
MTVQLDIEGEKVLQRRILVAAGVIDADWSSGGGAPLVLEAGETMSVEVDSADGLPGFSLSVTVMGFSE